LKQTHWLPSHIPRHGTPLQHDTAPGPTRGGEQSPPPELATPACPPSAASPPFPVVSAASPSFPIVPAASSSAPPAPESAAGCVPWVDDFPQAPAESATATATPTLAARRGFLIPDTIDLGTEEHGQRRDLVARPHWGFVLLRASPNRPAAMLTAARSTLGLAEFVSGLLSIADFDLLVPRLVEVVLPRALRELSVVAVDLESGTQRARSRQADAGRLASLSLFRACSRVGGRESRGCGPRRRERGRC